jgi:hypothetical protein
VISTAFLGHRGFLSSDFSGAQSEVCFAENAQIVGQPALQCCLPHCPKGLRRRRATSQVRTTHQPHGSSRSPLHSYAPGSYEFLDKELTRMPDKFRAPQEFSYLPGLTGARVPSRVV